MLKYTAKVDDQSASATHPFGLGIGEVQRAPGTEIQFAGDDGKKVKFRLYVPNGVGSRSVTPLTSNDEGEFTFPIGTVGDQTRLIIKTRANKQQDNWMLIKGTCHEAHRIGLDSLNEVDRRKVALYVKGILGDAAKI